MKDLLLNSITRIIQGFTIVFFFFLHIKYFHISFVFVCPMGPSEMVDRGFTVVINW